MIMQNLSFPPKTIDSGLPGPLAESLLINIGLIALFGLQQIWFNLIKKPIPEINYLTRKLFTFKCFWKKDIIFQMDVMMKRFFKSFQTVP